jgi:predicted SnoaL-like aldol condensation-catalyzing enzyme
MGISVRLTEEDAMTTKEETNKAPTPWIVVDIVRVEGERLAEHWDVIEDEVTRAQSTSGLPMFGGEFPA